MSTVCTCNDCVTLIVEDAEEDLICVPLQDLQTDSGVGVPQSSCLVLAGCEDSGALGAEADLPREARTVSLFLEQGLSATFATKC